MGFRMARALDVKRLSLVRLALTSAVIVLALGGGRALAAEPERPASQPQPTPPVPAITRECQTPAGVKTAPIPLPNTLRALQQRKKIRILAIGGASTARSGPDRGGFQEVFERIIEGAIKGLDVEIVNRGVSGELVRDAKERLKVEVALTQPDMVLWQVGTSDALARVPAQEFETHVGDMVRWLRAHKVDVVLVGIQYTRSLAHDPSYQAIRRAVRRVAQREGVLRVGRYEATEALERVRQGRQPTPPDPFATTEGSYACVAQYLAQAVTLGLFARRVEPRRQRPPNPAPAPAPEMAPTPPRPLPPKGG